MTAYGGRREGAGSRTTPGVGPITSAVSGALFTHQPLPQRSIWAAFAAVSSPTRTALDPQTALGRHLAVLLSFLRSSQSSCSRRLI
jgi:hypothetical protein